jgi:dTMP kinase
MLLAIEGIAGSGKSTLRNWLLGAATARGITIDHVGQFSWLSLPATRTLVRLRAGDAADGAIAALDAARTDMELHARHNIAPALARGPVIADRLALSTAALLALVHGGPAGPYATSLAEAGCARPDLTVLLTTPPGACADRVGGRATAPRFGEDPGTAAQLAGLLEEAADAWAGATGLPVIRHSSVTAEDLAAVGESCLSRLASVLPGPAATGNP